MTRLARTVASLALTLLAVGVAAPRPVAAQVTFDGLVYAHFRYGLERDTSSVPDAHQNNFELERAYLNLRSRSAGGIATRVTLAVDGRRAAAIQQSIRLKYAFVDWTPEGSPVTWRFGMQHTPIIGYLGELWGYRLQGTVPISRNGYQSSSDIGLGAEGAWESNAITAHGGVFNGEGYSAAPGDHHKDAALRISVRLFGTDDSSGTGGLRLTGYASVGRATGGATRDRYLALLTYKTKALTVGAEHWVTRDSTDTDPETEGCLTSVFATHRFVDSPVGIMARVDRWDPNTEVTPTMFDEATSRESRVVAGVSYEFTPNARVLLDADVVSTQGDGVPNAFQAANRSVYIHTEVRF